MSVMSLSRLFLFVLCGE